MNTIFKEIVKHARRTQTGGMWLLMPCLIFVLLVIVIFATMLYGVFIAQHHAEFINQQLTMQTALELNEANSATRLNELSSRARQLVSSDQDNYDAVFDTRHYSLEPLARYLLDQSRDGACLLDAEKKQCLAEELESIRQNTGKRFDNFPVKVINLPWLEIHGPELACLELGYLKNTNSSVNEVDQLDHIARKDRSSSLVDPKNGFYRANVDARLDDDNSDIPFKFASLPATLKGTTPEPRLVSDSSFIKTVDLFAPAEVQMLGAKFMPSAVQIKSRYLIINKFGAKQTLPIIVQSAAVTVGAAR